MLFRSLAAGKTSKSILISCGARLAVFDIAEPVSYTHLDVYKRQVKAILCNLQSVSLVGLDLADGAAAAPVSYTHLDVYKRQKFQCAEKQRLVRKKVVPCVSLSTMTVTH